MTPLLLVRLGTDEKDNSTLYAVIDKVLAVAMFTASNDDEALMKARAFAKDRELVCESQLAAVAQRRSAAIAELSPFQLLLKVHLAAARFLPEAMYGKVYDDRALVDFFDAVRAFSTAVVNDPRSGWSIGARLHGTIATTTFDREVLLLVTPGAEPGLHVISRTDADSLYAHSESNTADTLKVDRTVIELCNYPSSLIELATPAYELTMFPRIELVEDGKPHTFDEVSIELASAYLITVARRARSQIADTTWKPRIGGELHIELLTYDPPPA